MKTDVNVPMPGRLDRASGVPPERDARDKRGHDGEGSRIPFLRSVPSYMRDSPLELSPEERIGDVEMAAVR